MREFGWSITNVEWWTQRSSRKGSPSSEEEKLLTNFTKKWKQEKQCLSCRLWWRGKPNFKGGRVSLSQHTVSWLLMSAADDVLLLGMSTSSWMGGTGSWWRCNNRRPWFEESTSSSPDVRPASSTAISTWPDRFFINFLTKRSTCSKHVDSKSLIWKKVLKANVSIKKSLVGIKLLCNGFYIFWVALENIRKNYHEAWNATIT